MTASQPNERDTELTSAAAITIPGDYLDAYLMTSPNLDEVLILLAFFRLSGGAPGERLVVDEETLVSDTRLNEVLGATTAAQTSTSRIVRGLNRAVLHGALVRQWTDDGTRQVTRYAMPDRSTAGDQSSSPDFGSGPEVAVTVTNGNVSAASVYTAYEENIGMLTPLVADQIRLATELYPTIWIHDAIHEAVLNNRRQWRYIQRILQNWSTGGRAVQEQTEVSDATNQRGPAGSLDTDQYREGRHLDRARKPQL